MLASHFSRAFIRHELEAEEVMHRSLYFILYLHKDISTIDDRVASSLVRRRITSKIQEQALDLPDIAHATKWCHTVCLVDAQR